MRELARLREWLDSRLFELRQEWVEPSPEWFPVWNGYQELQSDRPLVVMPMGGAFRGEIPWSKKAAWLAAHGLAVASVDGELVMHLWREMEAVQLEHEAEAMKGGGAR